LATAHIGVNCSDSEGSSNAVLEYMLAGCAVVATDVGGNAELIESGRTGLLVPPDDAPALADGLRRLLAGPDLAGRLRRTARAQVESTFGWDRTCRQHESMYRDLLARARG
jgi:glycosyltransferase involved in cell wall biosynthesis